MTARRSAEPGADGATGAVGVPAEWSEHVDAPESVGEVQHPSDEEAAAVGDRVARRWAELLRRLAE